MENKLTQIELLNLAFEGVEFRDSKNQVLKNIILTMYNEEVALQKAKESEQLSENSKDSDNSQKE